MIAASAVLVVLALGLLIVGVFQDGLELVFGSIAASIIAAISLFMGVLKDRRAPAGAPGYPVTEGAPVGGVAVAPRDELGEAAPTAALEEEIPEREEVAARTPSLDEPPPLLLPDEEPVEVEIPPAPARAPKKPAARKPAAKKPAAKKAPGKKAAAKKPAAKKPAAKKAAAAKAPAKKAAAKKPAAKKASAKKPAAKKPATRRTTETRPPAEG